MPLPSAPYLAYVCNRRARRLRLGPAERAFVHFHLTDGTHWKLPLVDISVHGIAFSLDDGRPFLPVGTDIVFLEVHVGDRRVTGDARVMHVTQEFAVGTICGAEFAPTTSRDTRMLALLLEDIERWTPRTG